MNQLEKDIYRQCARKLTQWARDSVQLYEIAEIGPEDGFRSIIWLLLSLGVHICVQVKLPKAIVMHIVSEMYDVKEKDNVWDQSEGDQ